jgi:hypothetical protein
MVFDHRIGADIFEWVGKIAIMLGDLPPSSSVKRFIVSREFLATSFPICAEPVKAIF